MSHMAKITGAHAIIYSTDAEADRALLRDGVYEPGHARP